MIDGLHLDQADHSKRIEATFDAEMKVGRDLDETEARAFAFVNATPVTDDAGKVAGYWVGRYYTPEEYERLLPGAKAAVSKVTSAVDN